MALQRDLQLICNLKYFPNNFDRFRVIYCRRISCFHPSAQTSNANWFLFVRASVWQLYVWLWQYTWFRIHLVKGYFDLADKILIYVRKCRKFDVFAQNLQFRMYGMQFNVDCSLFSMCNTIKIFCFWNPSGKNRKKSMNTEGVCILHITDAKIRWIDI